MEFEAIEVGGLPELDHALAYMDRLAGLVRNLEDVLLVVTSLRRQGAPRPRSDRRGNRLMSEAASSSACESPSDVLQPRLRPGAAQGRNSSYLHLRCQIFSCRGSKYKRLIISRRVIFGNASANFDLVNPWPSAVRRGPDQPERRPLISRSRGGYLRRSG